MSVFFEGGWVWVIGLIRIIGVILLSQLPAIGILPTTESNGRSRFEQSKQGGLVAEVSNKVADFERIG